MTWPAGGGPAYQHLVHHLDAVGQVVRIDDLSSVPGKVRNNLNRINESTIDAPDNSRDHDGVVSPNQYVECG